MVLPIALCAPSQAQQAATGPDAEGMAGASKANKNRTRFIIGLERPVDFQVFALTNPNRVFVDLPDVMLQLPALPVRRPSASSNRSAAASRPPARPASSSMSPDP